jgi:hypothetical protein
VLDVSDLPTSGHEPRAGRRGDERVHGATEVLRTLLAQHAGLRTTVTYATIRSRFGWTGDLVPVLRALAETEDDAGRGLLTAVVVRADTGRPGAGWFRLASERGRSLDDPEACWQAERDRLAQVWIERPGES